MLNTTCIEEKEMARSSFEFVEELINFFYANKSLYNRTHIKCSENGSNRVRDDEFNGNEKRYVITYSLRGVHKTIIEARDAEHAFKKFRRAHGSICDVLCAEEYKS